MKQFHEDCDKLIRVFKSCKTDAQLISAWNYYKLWDKKYPLEKMPRCTQVSNAHTAAYVFGFIEGWFKLNR